MTIGSSCPAVPAEVAAWVTAGHAALALGDRADEWDAGTRRAVLAELDRIERLAAALRAKVVTAERDAGTWSLRGDRDLAGFVGRESRQGRGAGFAAVNQAATLAAMPAVADALVDGAVTPAHLARLTRAAGGSAALAEQMATPAGQEQVVALARRLDAAEFGKALERQGAALDPAWRQRTHDEQRAARFLQLSHTPGGTFLKGRFDAVAGNLVQRAIDALNPRPALDDDRDHGQRQADALTTMARSVLSDPGTTPGSVVPAQVTLMIGEETWAALRGPDRGPRQGDDGDANNRTRDSRRGEAGAGAEPSSGGGSASGDECRTPGRGSTRDMLARLLSVAPVTDEDGAVLPASVVATTLCDCRITRLVMDASGVPIDEGRGKRLFTAHQRAAVLARDGGGCAFPGCAMPARYTRLHHVTWWSRGGHTDLDQAVQLCDGHHGYVHDHDVRIRRRRDGAHAFLYPDGRLVAGSPPPDEASRPPGSEMSRLPGSEAQRPPRSDVPPYARAGESSRRPGQGSRRDEAVARTRPPDRPSPHRGRPSANRCTPEQPPLWTA